MAQLGRISVHAAVGGIAYPMSSSATADDCIAKAMLRSLDSRFRGNDIVDLARALLVAFHSETPLRAD
jgi:hypothetical protein